MHILVLYQGHYGQRIIEHIKKSAPSDWVFETLAAPRALPLIIDEPEEFLPGNIPQANLLLALSESERTAQLVPAIAKISNVKAVIMPVDNSSWLPLGLQNQVRDDIIKMGKASVFPKTFCSLTEKTAGFGKYLEAYDDETIATFATFFGWPKFRIKVEHSDKKIIEVVVERSAPCGSTHLVAEKLKGTSAKDAVPQAGLHCHHYPCLASMQMDPNGETLMHISGYVVNQDVERELKPRM